MDWTEIIVKTENSYADDCAAIAQMISNGIYIEDYSNLVESISEIAHTDLIDEELLNKDKENVKIHIYFNDFDNPLEKAGYIKERLNALSIPYEIIMEKIRDEDWANNWRQYYKPFEVGARLMIKPEWEKVENTGRVVLNIEPGLAFGTGTHETTKMCLELLDECVSEGDAVLDIGCGSGILSVAALLLGAGGAVAIDIDPLAVRSTKQNGELNGFGEDKLKVIEGNLVDKLESGQKFDVIMANIVADVIIKILPAIPEYLKEGGFLICSGIIEEKLGIVKAGLDKSGFIIEKICEEKGWAAILAKHLG